MVGDTICEVETGDATAPVLPDNSAGFRWTRAAGAMMLPSLATDFTDVLARDINESGTAIGGCNLVWVLKLTSGEEFVGPTGTPRQLNNRGVGVGQSGKRAIRWSPATGELVLYEDPTGVKTGVAWATNDRNEAVGEIQQSILSRAA